MGGIPLICNEWQRKLVKTERKLKIIKRIDEVRDTIPEPFAMRKAIAEVIFEEFAAAIGCVIAIVNSSGELVVDTVFGDGMKRYNPDYIKKITKESKTTEVSSFFSGGENGFVFTISASIKLNHELLGKVVLFANERDFCDEDIEILHTAEDYIDSAIIQGREFHRLQQLEKIIDTIERIDEIRDLHLEFNKMLSRVIREILQIIPGEDSAILLHDIKTGNIVLSATSNSRLFEEMITKKTLIEIAEKALEEKKLKNWEGEVLDLRSILCLPLVLDDRIIGVISAVNRRDLPRFNEDDEELLRAIGFMMDTAIFEGIESTRIKAAFRRSVSPGIMDFMLENPSLDLITPKHQEVSMLFADLRGSTALAEQTGKELEGSLLTPAIYADFINEYLENLAKVAIGFGGTIDKFVGDEIVVIFNAPLVQPSFQLLAIKAALTMQEAHKKFLKKWNKYGISNPIGVGIATGTPVVGEFGCDIRSDYTAIGRTPNWASRLCGSAQGGQILICPDTFKEVKNKIKAEPISGFTFKGIDEIVTVYSVLGLK